MPPGDDDCRTVRARFAHDTTHQPRHLSLPALVERDYTAAVIPGFEAKLRDVAGPEPLRAGRLAELFVPAPCDLLEGGRQGRP